MDRRRDSLPRIAALVLVVTAFPGCASWHAVKSPPAAYIAKEKPDVVRIALSDSILVLSGPTVEGDTVNGLAKNVHPHRWTGVSSASIRRMEVHNARNSTGAKIAAGSALMVFALMAALASRSTAVP